MERWRYDRICSVLAEIKHLQGELSELLQDESLAPLAIQLENIICDLRQSIDKEVEQALNLALARINLHDESYTFMRAIDGDTLEVQPPSALRDWMRDVHIRLYGIDAPESNDELGPAYTRLLDQLCRNNARGVLSIIWERERPETEYSEYPRTSFERGIGNVFIRFDDYLLYVNSFLAMHPHVHTTRDGRDLIRGRRWLEELCYLISWRGRCMSRFPEQILMNLAEIHEIMPMYRYNFPICLCFFPREIIPAAARSPNELWYLLLESIRSHGCPYSEISSLVREREINKLIESRAISPFDVLLILASKWKESNIT